MTRFTKLAQRLVVSAAGVNAPSAWVFLGPPGVGKGTYSKRVAEALGMSHIAAGDLVRDEIKSGSTLGARMQEVVNSGQLLSDSLILNVLRQRMSEERSNGITKFLLDGFPRTANQAEALDEFVDVHLAVNLDLREDVLVDKCLGRRLCSKCGANYNVADINVPAGRERGGGHHHAASEPAGVLRGAHGDAGR